MLLIFKALVSFAELLGPPLHCTFISSSWAKGAVDVVEDKFQNKKKLVYTEKKSQKDCGEESGVQVLVGK
ncbi:hypothetical protein AV530_015880 [Patagioenas fasciata monilis]|uniref:Uncharacterized protein n=1 Tax=Patagioenas fasciata monilis TaxID=372326 RepID=A0A1V4KJD3_PATFA|nr:hypothetical protein AV530_015880 [Patagioenas fasciata monilis]